MWLQEVGLPDRDGLLIRMVRLILNPSHKNSSTKDSSLLPSKTPPVPLQGTIVTAGQDI